MLYLTHHDDKKEKYQSHTIRFEYIENNQVVPPDRYNDYGTVILGTSVDSITSYGATKEDALKGVGEMLDWLVKEVTAIRDLYNSGVYQQNIIEVDCSGEPISEDEK